MSKIQLVDFIAEEELVGYKKLISMLLTEDYDELISS